MRQHVCIKQTPKAARTNGKKIGTTLGSNVQGATKEQQANLELAIATFHYLQINTHLIGDGLEGLLVKKQLRVDKGSGTWLYVLYVE